ncbi:hypothetical protein JCM6882_005065 [Rhodosporidiobolus microsporus]
MPALRLRALLLALLALVVSASASASSRVQVAPGEVDKDGRPTVTLGIDPAEGFTMMIATYKRDQNLPPLLKHLTTSPPPSLRHIVLIWQNVGVPLPDFLNSTALETLSTSGVAVTVRQSKRNSMNERFRPLLDWDEDVYTDAVMIMDDDVVLRRDALEWGYQEFVEANREGKGRLVGFTGRDFEEGKKDGEWSYTLRPKKTYSMVLSNAAWLRKEWLAKYWEETEDMQSLRGYVDEVFNCDDILINYLVSNVTGNPPLLLQPKVPLRTIGGDGLWSRGSTPISDDEDTSAPPPVDDGIPSANHFEQRKHCLAHYFSHFARYAPSSSPPTSSAAALKAARHFPLRKTATSHAQDVEDHSRWLYRNEQWEEPDFSKLVFAPAPGDAGGEEEEEEEELSEEEEAERAEFEKMLEGMTDEEIDELMLSLQDMIEGKDDGAEGEGEGNLPSDGEEGLEEMPEGHSVFEEDAEDVEDQTVLGHFPGEL